MIMFMIAYMIVHVHVHMPVCSVHNNKHYHNYYSIVLSSIIIYTKINTTIHAIRGVNLYREHTYHNKRVFFLPYAVVYVIRVTRQMIIIGGASLNELVSCARRSSHRY